MPGPSPASLPPHVRGPQRRASLGELGDGRGLDDGGSSLPPGGRTLIDVLDDALARQTDAVVGGIGRVEHAIARQTQLGIGLVALGMMLTAAYFGIGANVRGLGFDVGVSPANASAPPPDDEVGQGPDRQGTDGPANVSVDLGPTP